MIGFPKGETRKTRKGREKRAQQKRLKSVRQLCLERANGCCEWCGKSCRQRGEGHHKIPRSRGGKWTVENIVFICRACHLKAHQTGDLEGLTLKRQLMDGAE